MTPSFKIGNRAVPTINEHIKKIFIEGELLENSVIRNFLITALDAKEYNAKHYNLDVIISVEYRVKSPRGTQFGIWAANILQQYMLNGYAINDVRIKQIESSIQELVAKYNQITADYVCNSYYSKSKTYENNIKEKKNTWSN